MTATTEKQYPVLTPDEATALQKRVAELEGALRKIQNLARTGRPHPMSRKTDYFQIAATALAGGKDE